jgi:hypothetical protein
MPDRFSEETPEEAAILNRRLRDRFAEPFFSTEPPCVDCGHPLSECVCNIPDEPVCPDLYPQLIAALNVREIHQICVAHRLVCAACGGIRKPPARETATKQKAKAA